jgi:hypothetical protein
MNELTIIEAEFEDIEKPSTPGIRRSPLPASPTQNAQISMSLDKWLEVDRTIHELYQLCEFAIWQRDQARNQGLTHSERADALEEHVALLTTRLHTWMERTIELEQQASQSAVEAQRLRGVAAEALSLSAFDRRRRRELLNGL